VAIKIIASHTEEMIITSDPSQILSIKRAKEEYKLNSDTQTEHSALDSIKKGINV
jgi:hypothetical protein